MVFALQFSLALMTVILLFPITLIIINHILPVQTLHQRLVSPNYRITNPSKKTTHIKRRQ